MLKWLSFFAENNLISDNQSDDSCINQLLFITHEIHRSLNDNLEVIAIFLDISRACDKLWHKALIYKLKQNDISSIVLNTIIDNDLF